MHAVASVLCFEALFLDSLVIKGSPTRFSSHAPIIILLNCAEHILGENSQKLASYITSLSPRKLEIMEKTIKTHLLLRDYLIFHHHLILITPSPQLQRWLSVEEHSQLWRKSTSLWKEDGFIIRKDGHTNMIGSTLWTVMQMMKTCEILSLVLRQNLFH